MGKSKSKKSIKKVKPIKKIITNLIYATKKTKFNLFVTETLDDSIQRYTDKLLESFIYDLENYALDIQNKEFEIASEFLFEQFQNELKMLEEFKKAINGHSTLDKCMEIIYSNLDKKLEAIEFFSKKTYNDKPKLFICDVEQKIFDSDEFTDIILKNIRKNVPKEYFKYIFKIFFIRFQEYHTQIIQPPISRASIKFSLEVEYLNELVDEIETLYDVLNSKKCNIEDVKSTISYNINKVSSNMKLCSTYKTLHLFALHLGFVPVRQNATSHVILKKNNITVPIPKKNGDVKTGLLLSIIKQLGSSRDEFIKFAQSA